MKDKLIYLDTYVLQQDMRLRLPKSILSNMKVERGVSLFEVYLDKESNEIVLRVHQQSKDKG